MEENQSDVIITILLASLVIIVLAVFTLFFFIAFIRKRQVMLKAQAQLKTNFERVLLSSQLEIKEQTLEHISRELHDNIGQILSLVSLNLNTIKASDTERLLSTANLVDSALEDLRSLSRGLNTSKIAQMGVVEATKNELEKLERTGKFQTAFNYSGCGFDLTEDESVIVFRIIQESLNNAVKHAHARLLTAEFFDDSDRYHILIKDDGVGIAPSPAKGSGLINMYKRVSLINAECAISSEKGEGTTVALTLKKKPNYV